MQRKPVVNLGNLLLSLSDALDLAGPVLVQHQQKTAFIAWEVSREAGLPERIRETIFTAALLHDIGAISVEEKLALMSFEHENTAPHCIRGEALLRRFPLLKHISGIVRNHHREWRDWHDTIEDPLVLGSQIVFLADHVERLSKRNRYILHQKKRIMREIQGFSGRQIHPRVVDSFLSTADREEFWLDLVSPRLYPVLLHKGPFRNFEVDLGSITTISELFRDIIDFRSRFTAAHTSGVAACSEILARLFGLSESEAKLLRVAGNLHDIGKLCISNSILEKPGKLTEDEYEVVKCHSYFTYHIISTIGGLQQVAEWAGYHHERLDGSGYPFRCKADDLTIGSQIVAMADIFTALTEDRPYRAAMDRNKVIQVIKDIAARNLLEKRVTGIMLESYDEVQDWVREAKETAREFYEHQFTHFSQSLQAVG